MRILYVEDEKYIARAVAEVLRKNNYAIDLAHDGEFGLDCALSGIYDIIILDIMLPKIDGFSIIKEIRRKGIATPIILLTARDEIGDKVQGLDLGADDYLAKPFHTDELLARLRALGRRNTALAHDGNLCFGDITLSPHTLILSKDGNEIKLKLKEAQLMELLIKNKNSVVTKETIIEKLWGYDGDAGDNHVEVHISLLRKKLFALSAECTIQTIRGVGYALSEGRKSNHNV